MNNLGWSFLKDALVRRYPAAGGVVYTLDDLGWPFVVWLVGLVTGWTIRDKFLTDEEPKGGKQPEIVIDVSPEEYTREYNRRMGITLLRDMGFILPVIVTILIALCFFVLFFYGVCDWHYTNKLNAEQSGQPYEGSDWSWVMRGLAVFFGSWLTLAVCGILSWLVDAVNHRSITHFLGGKPTFLPVAVACKYCGTAIAANSRLKVVPGPKAYELECPSCNRSHSVVVRRKGGDPPPTSLGDCGPPGATDNALWYLCGKRLRPGELASRICAACRK